MKNLDILFKKKCKKCKYFDINEETLSGLPFCIACSYCKKKKHILQINLDRTLPVFCQICDTNKWRVEFDANRDLHCSLRSNTVVKHMTPLEKQP